MLNFSRISMLNFHRRSMLYHILRGRLGKSWYCSKGIHPNINDRRLSSFKMLNQLCLRRYLSLSSIGTYFIVSDNLWLCW